MNKVREIYEVPSQSFKDIPLERQIAFGINDWVAVDVKGREFFGRTKADAIEYCEKYGCAQ